MKQFFQSLYERLALAWHALCGHKIALYRNIVDGDPTAYRLHVARLKAGECALLVECVADESLRDGISTGNYAVIIGCTVTAVPGRGVTGH